MPANGLQRVSLTRVPVASICAQERSLEQLWSSRSSTTLDDDDARGAGRNFCSFFTARGAHLRHRHALLQDISHGDQARLRAGIPRERHTNDMEHPQAYPWPRGGVPTLVGCLGGIWGRLGRRTGRGRPPRAPGMRPRCERKRTVRERFVGGVVSLP